MMACKKCSSSPVFRLSGGEKLCKQCFTDYFEGKARKTIRQFGMLEDNDNVAVALSGGKDSTAVLNILHRMQQRNKNFRLFAVLIDEGISGYRPETIKSAKAFCKKNSIPLRIYSFKQHFGLTLDQMMKKTRLIPCSVCGVLRRYLINKAARELKATKLVTGHNADDESQVIIMNILRGNNEASARLGPITGVVRDKKFVVRVKPLYFLLEKEVTAYAFLNGLLDKLNECKYAHESYRGEVRDMLNTMEARHPGTKTGILNSFIEILQLLKQKYKAKGAVGSCRLCREPSSGDVCKACDIIRQLKG